MASDPRDTPAMRQHARFKQQHPGCILLFRMGDFYELFGDDAVVASRAIGLTLTQRSAGLPMAGVPHHQVEVYLRKFVAAGFRVAVCDQVQDPAEAKGLVERAVTRVITPGTLLDEGLLEDDQSNVLAAVCFGPEEGGARRGGTAGRGLGARVSVAVAELSTGQFWVLSLEPSQVVDELARRRVRELLFAEVVSTSGGDGVPARVRPLLGGLGISGTALAAWYFRPSEAREALQEQFGVKSLVGFGLADDDALILPAGALVRYLKATQLPSGDVSPAGSGGSNRSGAALGHLRPPRREDPAEHLVIDAVTLRALEIDRTIRGVRAGVAEAEGSLLGVFVGAGGRSLCRTAAGRRLLREWLVRPLRELLKIQARQRSVLALVEDRRLAGEVGAAFEPVQDVSRIGARVALRRASPRDIVALGRSVGQARALGGLLDGAPALSALRSALLGVAGDLDALAGEVARLCVDAPPAHLREGGLIRDGVDAVLDECRRLQTSAAEWMAEYQARLVAEHDLPNLKVGFNRVFGYYIELPKGQSGRAPAVFTRRQTLTNAERYITPELKAFEERATHAQQRALAREQGLFDGLCTQAAGLLGAIAVFGDAAASLDVLLAFADKAVARRWVMPTVVSEPVLEISQGRHPVLEQRLEQDFVPNDLTLGTVQAGTLALITGPNMAGKSTFIRQTALLVLLAHAGSFVPAQGATIGLCDRIFTRVGADDALFAGQSTFMVEMTETANILHHAGASSLVVLDEIGRGTSTLDGLSLAWAIAEELACPGGEGGGDGVRGPRTLFATHYHELTRLAELLPGRVGNLHVAVREWKDQVIFLHRIEPGRAEKSFGIHVARLAGLPGGTIARAKEILEQLSVDHSALTGGGGPAAGPDGGGLGVQVRGSAKGSGAERAGGGQMGLFAEVVPHPAVDALGEVELESLSPLEAFDALRRLKGLVQGGG